MNRLLLALLSCSLLLTTGCSMTESEPIKLIKKKTALEALKDNFGDDFNHTKISDLRNFLIENNYKMTLIDNLDSYEIDKYMDSKGTPIYRICHTILEKGWKEHYITVNDRDFRPCLTTFYRMRNNFNDLDNILRRSIETVNELRNCKTYFKEHYEIRNSKIEDEIKAVDDRIIVEEKIKKENIENHIETYKRQGIYNTGNLTYENIERYLGKSLSYSKNRRKELEKEFENNFNDYKQNLQSSCRPTTKL